MSVAADVLRLGFVVEGEGEMEAVPLLTRRICHELHNYFPMQTSRPVRITKSKLLRPLELERAVRLARLNSGSGAILILIDADRDCPAILGPQLKARALSVLSSPDTVSVVLAKQEFETWFLAAAESLGGKKGLHDQLSRPPAYETIQGAKEWLTRNMPHGAKYSPTVDQAALVAAMDLNAARSCQSFDRLCRELHRLINPKFAEQ